MHDKDIEQALMHQKWEHEQQMKHEINECAKHEYAVRDEYDQRIVELEADLADLKREVRKMLRALDRYNDKCNELGPEGNRYWEHDDDFAYWELYEKRRERLEKMI